MTIALITGGSRGLGRSAALHLAKMGVDLILTYRSNKGAAQSVVAAVQADGRKAVALHLDTAIASSFPAFVETLKETLEQKWNHSRINFLVNNAGHGIFKSFSETTEAEFDGLMATHLKGVFFLTQTLLPLIEDGGRILNVSTGLARFTLPGYAAYATMKGGVEVMTRYLAKELGARGISVNAIAPGATETDFSGGVVRDVPDLNRMVAGQTAMGRAGLPDDIGGAIATLLTKEIGWMTGQRIEVSGGQNL